MAIRFNSSKSSPEEFLHKWIQFFNKNWVYFVGGIFLFASVFYRFSTLGLKNKKALLASSAIYSKWANSLDEQSFQKLENLIKKNPSKHLSFAPLIANKFLENEEYERAKTYAQPFLDRMEGVDSFYSLFSQTSLLIGGKDYEKALLNSLKLKQALENAEDLTGKYHNLYVSNCLRIIFLQKTLKQPGEEMKAIQQLESFLKIKEQKNLPFSEKNQDYLSSQKEALTLYLSDRKEQLEAPL